MKKVSVVILNWNGKHLLEQFLPSVVKYTDSNIADIIVADNASSDDSISFIQENYPTLSIIRLSENFGYAEGYNQALKQIETEYSILLNSDVEATANWLAPMINFLDAHPNIVAVQPKILAQQNKNYFEYAGASGGFIDKYGYPFCRGRIFDSLEEDENQYDQPIDIFWASGACLVIRTKEYLKAGGLDASFFAHMEEIDLCWRLNARGLKVVCIPQSVVYHVGGATLAGENPKKTFLNFRNNLVMLYKNLDDKAFRKIYKVRFFLDYLAALQMILKGKTSSAKATHQAHIEFKKIKKNYNSLRDENLNKQTSENIKTIYPNSLLWQFYVKGHKTFKLLSWNIQK
ncbi:glycosyltransferase family 2 protein [Dysgonomonas sp. GY617]|uniref:glycosyltransferase family 2 protein n=1 Tax=Dysgonomonas sp. GY617 TaxID=2780420 RepID=UPI0018841C38|nr:glycosyltransferase family 2 protein [Dysgonomonas sp. GY617]MBF0575891.1 glycosyltransferase family 2 protein [Dysgonomonas sp. GY617]